MKIAKKLTKKKKIGTNKTWKIRKKKKVVKIKQKLEED